MKTVNCPDCLRRVRPCNLVRHRRTHMPWAEDVWWGTLWHRARRPLLQLKHDHRYDEVAPRGVGKHRFRIYRLRGGELEMLASTDSAPNFGIGLYALYWDRRFFIADDSVGVLDTINADGPGDWIVHPFALGRRREGRVAA